MSCAVWHPLHHNDRRQLGRASSSSSSCTVTISVIFASLQLPPFTELNKNISVALKARAYSERSTFCSSAKRLILLARPKRFELLTPKIRSLELRSPHFSEQLAYAMFRIEPEHVKSLSQRAATRRPA
jgi:hypothetical protein